MTACTTTASSLQACWCQPGGSNRRRVAGSGFTPESIPVSFCHAVSVGPILPIMQAERFITLSQFFKMYPNDEICLQYIFTIRYGQGYRCPRCKRPAHWYRIRAERAVSCQWCGHHLHPTARTPFADSRTPLQLWFYAIYLFTTSRYGVPATELREQLGVTYKTAWRMARRIRRFMAGVDGALPV